MSPEYVTTVSYTHLCVSSYSRAILLCAFKWLLVKCLIIGRDNCNTIVFNFSEHVRDSVVNYELFKCKN